MMPFFRRKTDSVPPRASSISLYGKGRTQALHNAKRNDSIKSLPDCTSFTNIKAEDRPHPLAFAEATFDPSLPVKTKSRLSKELDEVLHDNAALAYFIQFMDAQKAKHFIKFWLDTESFQISTDTKQNGDKNDSNLTAASLARSGSSGYASDKSDEVFHATDQNHHTRGTGTTEKHSVNGPMSNKSGTKMPPHSKIEFHNSTPCDSNSKALENGSLCDSSQNIGHPKVIPQDSADSGCDVRGPIPSIGIPSMESENSNGSDNGVRNNGISAVELSSECLNGQSSDAAVQGFVKLKTSMEQDAAAIFSKYIAHNATCPVGVPDHIRETIKNCIYGSTGEINSECFVPAQEFVVQHMDKEYYPNFLRSSFHCKHQIDVLTSGNVFLADVLYNDSALFYFMEYMEQEGVRHLVDFLLTADNFQKHLLSQDNYDSLQAQNDAMVLYDKYFSLQASIPLGFSDSVRFEIETNICRDGGPLPDCFLKPVNILTQYLEKTFLLQFLSSQLYFKYISECIIIIQNDGTDSTSHSKYTASDSGSEQSLPISTINTLLAMDSKQPGASRHYRNTDEQDNFLSQSDALWKRPLAGKLQMAHVDHLGRVTMEFEPEPGKKAESKISKAVKKLVNWEEDKNQEEMAWKVAERIVRDICSVTMPDEFQSGFPEDSA